MEMLYRLFLTLNSTYLIIVIFLVKGRYYIEILGKDLMYLSWIIFVLIPVLFTALSFLVAKSLPNDNISKDSVIEVELGNNTFLPTYLGYFFVSLSVNNCSTLIVVFFIIYVFTFLSQSLYFNPIFLLFGYQFYFIKTNKNSKIFLITKKQLKTPNIENFGNLKRINNYTFLDI
jgi:hypothetical protein|nr:hypothetical protein [Candidatus Brachybacter algidus]